MGRRSGRYLGLRRSSDHSAWTRPWRSVQVARSVVEAIRHSIGSVPAEHGGMLGRLEGEDAVRLFHYDELGARGLSEYSPDTRTLNGLLKRWNEAGVRLVGFVHSHPPGIRSPSLGDERYAARILDAIEDMDELLLPIVMSEADTGRFEISWYGARRSGWGVEIERVRPVVVEDAELAALPHVPDPPAPAPPPTPTLVCDRERTFARLAPSHDLEHLADARVVLVGVGGSTGLALDLVRSGVGDVVLIDPDVVDEPNLGTQHALRADIGRPKVHAARDRLRDLDPALRVRAIQARVEELDDDVFAHLLTGGDPSAVLLVGCTDSFEAQARVNRLALHFGVPSLCAQLYQEGRGGELSFTAQGLTCACHRCALGPRYRAYERGYVNEVGSAGTTIMATTWINAVGGSVALALLHIGSDHPRWINVRAGMKDRNLVQLRMDPDLEIGRFERTLGRGPDIFFGETLWLPQEPECPATGFAACLDCGGTGDLEESLGAFSDTRVMRWPVDEVEVEVEAEVEVEVEVEGGEE